MDYGPSPLGPNRRAHLSTTSSALNTPPRPGTPNTETTTTPGNPRSNPFNDGADSRASTRNDRPNPFASPDASRPASSFDSSRGHGITPVGAMGASTTGFDGGRSQRYFHSRRVKKGEVEKPWLKTKDPKEKWVTILPILGIIIGLGLSGFLVWDGINSVVQHKYCEVLIEDFSRGLREDIWTKEVELSGFGNGEFGMTTPGDENVFIKDGNLVIRATLQDESLVQKTAKIDLLEDGTCTSKDPLRCIAVTNTTAGNATIVPPAKTGRIHTRKGASIKYGRVEVTAKLPKGDWLWPAIWMMPVKDTYGVWPASGEIDIMESRGNNYSYPGGGNDVMSSALHWGPNPAMNGYWRTNNARKSLHTTYSDGFNTFGVEWSQKYLFTYVNSRLLQVMYTSFDKPFWQRGGFPQFSETGERVDDIWGGTGRKQTPFDHRFFLILNVAVGSQNGWFEDGPEKPWRDGSENAPKDFWNNRDSWYPTWTQPQMEVSKVEMWQQCDGDEEL